MKVNDVLRKGDTYLRVSAIKEESCFCINCKATTMPAWMPASELEAYTQEDAPTVNTDLSVRQKQIAHERFTMIAPILAFLTDDAERNRMLGKINDEYDVSKQTLRRYLYKYLVYQDIAVLAPAQREQKKSLTQDQKNMRWALNKFFYTTKKSKLTEAYVHLLKEKYCEHYGGNHRIKLL